MAALGAAHARRRTFASGILPFAHCTPAALRHPGSACRRARLPGTGSPSLRPLPVAQVVNLCAFPIRTGLGATVTPFPHTTRKEHHHE